MSLQPLMRQFSIRVRMIGAIGVVLALLLLVGSAGLWGMQRLHALSEHFVGHAYQETIDLSRLRLALADLRRHEKDMVIQYESPEQLSLAHMQWEKSRTEIGQYITAMRQGEDDEDNVILRDVESKLKDYSAAVEPVVSNIKNGGYDSATVANRMLARAHERFDLLQVDIKKIEAIVAAEATSLLAEEKAASDQTKMWFALALAVAALVVVPTTLANMQSICQPLSEAQRLATAITEGDLTQRIHVRGKDELTRLTQALAGMQDSLARIVGEVRNTSDSISTASAEIASGNQDLSNRTEQTAGNLQQTASSIEQINSTVRQSADAASQASQMAVINAQVAERGGRVVGQVVATMDEINHSSKKISDIIGVIDGIAFQTNILALNAAVEAARAGEQGRGFAVVAGEVRSLAQRSAEAAKEIKGLIGASVDRVDAGSRLVADAGSTIGEIVANAEKMAAFISDITTAANEQSQGIGQVNTAVGVLDQMTQQNAALVEESAAAAQSLKEQAIQLASVVATFRLSPVRNPA